MDRGQISQPGVGREGHLANSSAPRHPASVETIVAGALERNQRLLEHVGQNELALVHSIV
jgi:hypothetical protein